MLKQKCDDCGHPLYEHDPHGDCETCTVAGGMCAGDEEDDDHE